MKRYFFTFIILAVCFACDNQKSQVESKQQEAPEAEHRVFFIQPQNNDTLSSPISVKMGVEGMQVEPAGVSRQGYGHHHILVNMKSWTVNSIIPMSDSTFHYGKGQVETTLDLNPGNYMLSLQFGDGVHASYGETMATSINITVE